MTAKRLILFDIDGTLISTNGHGVKAMMEAYTQVWGRNPEDVPFAMSGKTEFQISHELLGLMGFSRDEVNQGLPEFFQRYPEALRRHLTPERTQVHAGIRPLLEKLKAHQNVVLGLLTGNCEEAAWIKMDYAGLDGFEVGAFGEHNENRADLPPLAVDQARQKLGLAFSPEQVVVIGDAPNDILCAQANGARSVAVATGRFDAQALSGYNPDFIFQDLSQVDEVLDTLIG